MTGHIQVLLTLAHDYFHPILSGFCGGLFMTLFWKGVCNKTLLWSLAEYLPGFLFATICVVIVSLLTRPPKNISMDHFVDSGKNST